MDFLAQIPAVEVPDILLPTYRLFVPRLLHNPALRAIQPQSHVYGYYKAQELDVYMPPIGTEPAGGGDLPPICVFVYGGGYTSGGRQMEVPPEVMQHLRDTKGAEIGGDVNTLEKLYYRNIGAFIAERGFVAVIPDYRLVSTKERPDGYKRSEEEALFPSGGEDLLLAMQWAVRNLEDVADVERIYAVGHSAGANHLCTLLLSPGCLKADEDLARRLTKVVCLSATYDYVDGRPERKVAWSRYFGSFEAIAGNCPLGLVRSSDVKTTKALPPMLCLHCARDPPEVLEPQSRFWEAWTKKAGRGEMRQVAGAAHNHLSPVVGIGSGDEEVERWLVEALEWCVEDTGVEFLRAWVRKSFSDGSKAGSMAMTSGNGTQS